MSLQKKVQQNKDEAATTVSTSSGLHIAKEQWLLNNNISKYTSSAFWAPDLDHMKEKKASKPWVSEPNYFKEVKVSALAALKMFIHAKTGSPDFLQGREDWFEVMGLMTGHFHNDVLIITDSFALPVKASEVECSMDENSLIYQANFLDYHRNLGKPDAGCVGWYHSHPGYTCFLSGIDVNTQRECQRFQDPYVAIVVDPVRTLSTGQLDLKAFRTYTHEVSRTMESKQVKENYTPDIPSKRIKEFGVHAHCYYELPVTLIRSEADEVQLNALLSRYWSVSFNTNLLVANRNFNTKQVNLAADLAAKRGYNSVRNRRERTVRDEPDRNAEKIDDYTHNCCSCGTALLLLNSTEEELIKSEKYLRSTDPIYCTNTSSLEPLYRNQLKDQADDDGEGKSAEDESGKRKEDLLGDQVNQRSIGRRAQVAGEAVAAEMQASTLQLEVKRNVFASGV